jgi:hypothetical protein
MPRNNQRPSLRIYEKNTDVNLVTDLITHAWTKAYGQAVVCTNDTDIVGVLASIKQHHPELKLGLIAPIKGTDHRKICAYGTNKKWKVKHAKAWRQDFDTLVLGATVHKQVRSPARRASG